jgi:hypothetical protein
VHISSCRFSDWAATPLSTVSTISSQDCTDGPTVNASRKQMPWLQVSKYADLEDFIKRESTFFRLHLLSFIITPLIASVIFWACNGRFHIDYVDALFLCYSAMTVTGLATVKLSTCTSWQQVILYVLMILVS